jgi:hypothetical protein
MTVRAKFICTGIQQCQSSMENDAGKQVPCVATEVSLTAVYESPSSDSTDRGNAALENRIFGRATPSASVKMMIMVESVAAAFKVGKSYYADFSAAE